jgi:hypothetical protein
LAVISCGGGGGVGTGGTGAVAGYSNGPITGYGSIIVNGVHFDESAATVLDDDGAPLSRDALKLGMTVQIDSGTIDNTALTATALTVNVYCDVLGPVSASNLATGVVTVLGQPVQITQSTLFDASLSAGQSALTVGQVVEVYAIYDPVAGTYAARLVQPAGSVSHYKVRGQVQGLNTATRTFQVGSQTFTYASGAQPAGLSNGATLKLTVATTPDDQGRWVLSGASQGQRAPANGVEAEIEAVVSSYTSLSQFTVGGVVVDASAAQISPSGSSVAAGVRVEVEGTMSAGVLVATKVDVKGSSGTSGGDDEGQGQEFELNGTVSALDTLAKTFVIRGQTVSYAGSVNYDGGTAANLSNGVKLEVKGTRAASAAVVQAQEIKFED